MQYRIVAATAVTAAALALAGCNTKTGTAASPPRLSISTAPVSTSASPPPSSASPKTGTLPNLVGKGLQSAQDTAQAAGFDTLKSHDALGRDRHQILDRGWKVCTQTPAPGTRSTDATVDLGAVKTDETCPQHDAGTSTPKAGTTMPNFHGKAVSAARDALPSDTSLSVGDASGQGRIVIIESNWQVCSQSPAAGTKLTGQPVSFKAVKFGEACP
ncbi:hypothetical protein [Streptacidiphilus sp. PAMC 29251]